MFKRNFLSIVLCTIMCVSGVSAQDLKSLLTGVAKTVIGDKATTAETIVGTWNFVGPDCRFESDNLLAQAGGEAASQQIEKKLEKVFDKLGMDGSQYVFASDGTYSFTRKGKTSNGTYTFDADNKTIAMKSKLGVSVTANVTVTGSSMSLLFHADKLMTALKVITNLTAQVNSTASTIGSLMDNYDGLLLGFELKKQ